MSNLYMTPTGALAKDGSDPDNAFDWDAFRAWTVEGFVAGDSVYAESGNYTPATSPGDADGTVAAPLSLIGITNLSDLTSFAQGADRPLFDFRATPGTHLWVDNSWIVRNVQAFADSGYTALRVDTQGIIDNCYGENIGTGYGLNIGGLKGRIVNSTAKSLGTAAVQLNVDCLAHGLVLLDSPVGVRVSGFRSHVVGCLINNCPIGIDTSDKDQLQIIGNTLYNGVTGILGANSDTCNIIGNIISGFTTPADWTTEQLSNWLDWNVWHDSDTPVNVTKGPNAINADPKFVDAAGGDFRVQLASAQNVGLMGRTVGAVQRRSMLNHPGMAGGMRG